MDDSARKRQEDWERSLASWKAKQGQAPQVSKPVHHTSHLPHEPQTSSALSKFLIFLAFAIPVALLGYALYINYLPFGYEETYTLTIDEEGIISPLSNEIYLTTPQGRKLLSLPEGVQGQVNLVLDPNIVLKDATLDVVLNGEGVYLATPVNISEIEWDYNWDFTQSVPEDLEGAASYDSEQQCVHFNAYEEQTLSLPNSQNLFESGPMSIYVKWRPSTISQLLGNNQQIVGHYNWEIYQSKDSIRFQVGRMNDANGSFYLISYPITDEFFNKEHELLAIYSPDTEGKGYIEFWVDNNLAGRTLTSKDIIYQNYNSNRTLSSGWSSHNGGNNAYFDGCIYETKIINSIVSQKITEMIINNINQTAIIPVVGKGNITSVSITVSQ